MGDLHPAQVGGWIPDQASAKTLSQHRIRKLSDAAGRRQRVWQGQNDAGPIRSGSCVFEARRNLLCAASWPQAPEIAELVFTQPLQELLQARAANSGTAAT